MNPSVPPMPPVSLSETEIMRQAPSLETSHALVPEEWWTEAERSNYTRTGSYDQTIAFCRRLEEVSSWARLLSLGWSGEGRELFALAVSKDQVFTPGEAEGLGKPVLLVQNGIHPGENGGKDATLLLLRDLLVAGQNSRWLDKVLLLVIPVLNPDGHEQVSAFNRLHENGPEEMGFRANARRLNLNRDYIKADSPEMRAWLRLYSDWLPDFLVDNHVTDGGDAPYGVTIATHTEQDIAPQIGEWVRHAYLPALFSRMEQAGHLIGWYPTARQEDGPVVAMTGTPRYSTGYAAARNRAALLVETHSLKSFRARTWAHYDILRLTLELLTEKGEALYQAKAGADRSEATLAPGEPVFLHGRPTGPGDPYVLRTQVVEVYDGTASGGLVPRYTAKTEARETTVLRRLEPVVMPTAPWGYLIPRPWSELVELLRLHGIKASVLETEADTECEFYRFDQVVFARAPFEGRFLVESFQQVSLKERHVWPAGTVYVPTTQRGARLAMHLLEPAAPDSLLRWGFFHTIFEQKEYFSDYAFEPYAAAMLQADPALEAAFAAYLRQFPEVAQRPRARLEWLYRRSPYYEKGHNLYPIARLLHPLELSR